MSASTHENLDNSIFAPKPKPGKLASASQGIGGLEATLGGNDNETKGDVKMDIEVGTEIFEGCVDDCSLCKYLSDCSPDHAVCFISLD